MEPGKRAAVDTGVRVVLTRPDPSVSLPPAAYARIAPRSGLALRGIDVAAGVCDADYRGTYRVVLVNNSDADFEVKPGDRIAQLILESIAIPVCVRVAAPHEDLLDSVRGMDGFGSTGSRAIPGFAGAQRSENYTRRQE